MNPLVSVIVPIHNGARFLDEAFDSVFAQTYAELELVVVDDGSTDDGAGLALARNATLVRQDCRGVAAARNAGVDLARGDILTFLDQDDVWLPTKIARQVEALLARPGHVSTTLQEYFLEDGIAPPPWFGKHELLEREHTGYVPSCIAMSRATFERVGRFDERFAHASDSDWMFRARHAGVAVEVIPETLVRLRIHSSNDSGSPAVMRELLAVARASAARQRGAR